MINEQELAEAIETISEGGQALGVSCEDVYRAMAKNDGLLIAAFRFMHEGAKWLDFDEYAESMLKEALRAKQEVDNGLL